MPRMPIVVLVSLIVMASLGSALAPRPVPRFLWNRSPSSPTGLYVAHARPPRRGEFAVAWLPERARAEAARRSYLPLGVPLVKKVAAAAGDTVCANGPRVTIEGHVVAWRQQRDRKGRSLASWSGCRRLRAGELFLLSLKVPGAYDGRYFGITQAVEVIGTAKPLWTS